jgi:hypothetical protein
MPALASGLQLPRGVPSFLLAGRPCSGGGGQCWLSTTGAPIRCAYWAGSQH